MYKLCKTEQSTLRQREIEEALFDLMKAKRYEDITITELSEKMNMPRKAFYRYFDSKEDALAALIDHAMADYTGFSIERSNDKNRSLTSELEEYFKFWMSRRELLAALERSSVLGTLIERSINYPIEERIAIAKFLPEDDPEVRSRIFKFAFAGMIYTMIEWYKSGFKTPARDMAKATGRMFTTPLFPNLSSLGIGL